MGIAGYGSWRYGGFHPDQYYLIGIPLAMIALTVLLARYASQIRYRPAILLLASAAALFAGLLWMGVWGADV
ncbi:MAG: hypothetical protein ACTHJR_12360 [Sphingomonas sp.]|uniref:hypothetical protein n=1 Tax=Sphingomonas sp. TaxID=28214 RepID=UPI003F7FB9CD